MDKVMRPAGFEPATYGSGGRAVCQIYGYFSHAVRFLGKVSPLVLVVAALASACSSPSNSPLAPTATSAVSTTLDLDYAINVPDLLTEQALAAAHPDGVRVSPVAAQTTWNYTSTYGSPNAYWGPLAPADGTFILTGVAIAPPAVAQEASFLGSEWPALYGNSQQRYAWVGRFVYAIPRSR